MYVIRKSIDIDFSHHVHGHLGPCINLHGHTWKFEVGLSAEELDANGFVVDFNKLKKLVLKPCHTLLDHSLALNDSTYAQLIPELTQMGQTLLATRAEVHGMHAAPESENIQLPGARNEFPGGMKVAVFDFNPTSERLAHWLYTIAVSAIEDQRVTVAYGRVFETLRPVESVAEYRP